MRSAFLPIALLALCTGCRTAHTPREAHEPHGYDVEWSYTGATGPEHWGELAPEYVTASTGHQQSPIDISDVVVREPHGIELHYEPTQAVMVNSGHSIEVDFEKGPYFVLDGVRYDLIQFHFHAPSEHTIDHQHFDLEAHFVHEDARGTLAVVAVMYVEGGHNPARDRFWEKFPKQPGERAVLPDVFSRLKETFPRTNRHYRYEGSLTTPPCTEGVLWLVMHDPVEVSRAQIERFREFYAGNNRPVQPRYGRTVLSE